MGEEDRGEKSIGRGDGYIVEEEVDLGKERRLIGRREVHDD